MKNPFKKFFKKKLLFVTEKMMIKEAGEQAYIRNGVGYGFISDDWLYDNAYLELGFGRVSSGRGDWGGGFEYTSDSAIKITIDKNYRIQKVETKSFYNNRSSQEKERELQFLAESIKVGMKFEVVDPEFKANIDRILNYIPCKNHIGWDVFRSPHMIDHYTQEKEKDYYHRLRDSEYLHKPKEDKELDEKRKEIIDFDFEK